MKTEKEYPQDLIGKCFRAKDYFECYEGSEVEKGEFIIICGFETKKIIKCYNARIRDGVVFITKNSVNFYYFDDNYFNLRIFLEMLDEVKL